MELIINKFGIKKKTEQEIIYKSIYIYSLFRVGKYIRKCDRGNTLHITDKIGKDF